MSGVKKLQMRNTINQVKRNIFKNREIIGNCLRNARPALSTHIDNIDEYDTRKWNRNLRDKYHLRMRIEQFIEKK